MMVLTVMYPTTDGARFDWDYYNDAHIPLVRAAFAPTGLLDTQVLRGVSARDGGTPPYVAIANLVFADQETMNQSLTGPRAGEISADRTNFTDIMPVAQLSTIV
jgi:uncharacterized protein (TIGR02118 family)